MQDIFISYRRKRLERLESAKAKEKMSIGGQGGFEDVQNFAHLEQGKTRDIIAEKLNIGFSNLNSGLDLGEKMYFSVKCKK